MKDLLTPLTSPFALKPDFGRLFLEELAILKQRRSERVSSWDRRGKNSDWIFLRPGETQVLAEIPGPGCIKRIYALMLSLDPFIYRRVVIRCYWEGCRTPSVEVPVGDFFGMPHGDTDSFSSLLLSVIRTESCITTHGMTAYFPMPFSESARLELTNESEFPIESFWYHVDYHRCGPLGDEVLRFHARWNRECPTRADSGSVDVRNEWTSEVSHLSGTGNYVIMDAKGRGQMVGFVLGVDNLAGGWWGEGDDMVFVDGAQWPPTLHGTGTEEIFGGGASPNAPFATPYCGFPFIRRRDWSRQNTMYRFFVTDPIRFDRSLRYTIEHGHANNCENDYSSVAYWYQTTPGSSRGSLPPASRRLPWLSEPERPILNRALQLLRGLYSALPTLVPQVGESFTLSQLLNLRELSVEAVLRNRILGAFCAFRSAVSKGELETAERALDTAEGHLRELLGTGKKRTKRGKAGSKKER